MYDINQLRPSKLSRYAQGYVDPRSCHKLFEQLAQRPIAFRSAWELKYMRYLERCKNVRRWGSECLAIPYKWIDGNTHKYYPDFFVEMEDGTCKVVEIKPLQQTHAPVNESNQWLMREYTKNMCKWNATREFCNNKGYKFEILTEKTINQL